MNDLCQTRTPMDNLLDTIQECIYGNNLLERQKAKEAIQDFIDRYSAGKAA